MGTFTSWEEGLDEALAQPFPLEDHEIKSKGGQQLFVPWHRYAARLNALVGPEGWTMGDPILREVGGKLLVGVPVTILGVTRVNFGDEAEDKEGYGSAVTNAWAQGFKRTLALFGMGLYMYEKADAADIMRRMKGGSRPAAQREGPSYESAPQSNGGGPKLATPNQHKFLWATAMNNGWSKETFQHYMKGRGLTRENIYMSDVDGIAADLKNEDVLHAVVMEMAAGAAA